MTRGRYIDQQKYCRNLQAFDQILDTINAYTPGSFYCPEHEVVCHKGEHDISKTGYLCQFCTKTFYQTRQRRKSSTIKKIDDEQCQQDFEEFIKHFNLHKERLQKQQQQQQLQQEQSSHDCQMSTSSSSSVSSISITSMNSSCSTNTLESSIEDLTTEFKTKASINNGLEMSDRRCSSTPNLLKLLRHDSIKSNNNTHDNYNEDDDNNNNENDDDDDENIEPIEIFTQGYLMDENYKSESLSVAEVGFIQQQRAKYFQKYLKLSNRFGTLNKDTTTTATTRKNAKVDPRLRKRKYINASYFGDSVYLSGYSDSYDSSDDEEEEEEVVEEQEEELYENVSDDDITPTRVLVDNQQEEEEDEESDYSIDSDDDDYYEDSEDDDYYYEENEEGQLQQQEQQNLAQRHPSIVEFNVGSALRRNNNSNESSSSSSSSCTPLEPLSYSLTNVYEREISDGEEEDHDDDDDVFGNNNNVDYFTMMLAQAQHPITVATAARALNNNSTYHNHHRRHSVSSISAIVGNNKSNNNNQQRQQKHHQHNSITPVSSICTDSTTGTANVDMINNSQNVDIMAIEKKSKLLQFINKPQVESSSSSSLLSNNNNNNNKKKFISHKPRFSLPFITPFSSTSSSSSQQQQKHQEKSTVFPLSNDCILNLHKSSTSSSSSSSTVVSPTLTVSSSSIKTTRESIMSKNIISRQYDKLQRKIKQSFL